LSIPESLEFATGLRPVLEMIDLAPVGERAIKLDRYRRAQAKAREATQEYAEQLASLYSDIERSGHNAEWLKEAAEIIRKREEADRELFQPGVQALKEKLYSLPPHSEAFKTIEDSLGITETWLSLLVSLHAKLLKLAAGRKAAAQKIRHARPVKGEIDHAALSREFMTRFPKIRAALAK
jgi:hypothetical protein